jgi:hypothetical protein
MNGLLWTDDTKLQLNLAVRHSIAETDLILASYRKHQEQKTSDAYRCIFGRTEAYQDAVRAYPEIRRLVGPRRFAEVMHHHTTSVGNYWFWMEQDYIRAAEYLWHAYLYRLSDLDTLIKLAWCWTPPMPRKLV